MVRVKFRYCLLEIVTNETDCFSTKGLKDNELYMAISSSIIDMHGDYGMGCVTRGIKTKYLNPQTRIAILRIFRSTQRIVLSSLPFITKIGKLNANLRLLHLGGSVRSCNKYLKKYQQNQLAACINNCKTEEEKKLIQDIISNSLTV